MVSENFGWTRDLTTHGPLRLTWVSRGSLLGHLPVGQYAGVLHLEPAIIYLDNSGIDENITATYVPMK